MISILLIVIFFVGFSLFCVRVYSKLTCGICKCSQHLVGKVAIITGANSGIGYETAKDFALRGAKVILACRNEGRGSKARDKIKFETGNELVVYKHLDLSSLKSVRNFAKDILENERKLDILVNNAGGGGLGNKVTEDGLLIGMQVNHFGPFLLTNLLLPLLKKSAPSRIVTVTSIMHKYAEIDFENLNMEKEFDDYKVYKVSKLCNVLMTVELSKKLRGSGVTANCLHPGVVATDIFRNIPIEIIVKVLKWVVGFAFKNCWEGAQSVIYLSVTPSIKELSGEYFSDCALAIMGKTAFDGVTSKRLWKMSEELVKL